MKYIKLFENFNLTDRQIHAKCKKYGIENYTINNGVVDVDGSVSLYGFDLIELPLKFGTINGNFNCGGNRLRSEEHTSEL